MYETPKYVYYRNKRIPGWWEDYLPDEQNPYQDTDTLTLERGYLADYWHFHSSNKHPNFKGADACNFVHEMIYRRFGGAFLTSNHYGGGRRGEHSYREPDHIVYENAYIGEDGNIHIENARVYFEDVVVFIQQVLSEISRNRYPSPCGSDARIFFPTHTDAESEAARKKWKEQIQRTEEYKLQLSRYMNGEEFMVNELTFDGVCFNGRYELFEGWSPGRFIFSNLQTNISKDHGTIEIYTDISGFYHASDKRKNIAAATETANVFYCLTLRGRSDPDRFHVEIPIPEAKISDSVKQIILDACIHAMNNYNKDHIELIEDTRYTPTRKYYPYNFFLDNKIGKLQLSYTPWIRRR